MDAETKTAIALSPGDFVRGEHFVRAYKLHTVRSYYRARNAEHAESYPDNPTMRAWAIERYTVDPEKAHQNAIEKRHPLAFCVSAGFIIEADTSLRKARNKAEKEAMAKSILLASGDRVEIEGATYTVKINREGDSSVIDFQWVRP